MLSHFLRKWLPVVLGVAIVLCMVPVWSSAQVPSTAKGDLYKGETINVVLMNHASTVLIRKFLPEFEKATGMKVNMELLGQKNLFQKEELELAGMTGAYDVMHFSMIYRAKWLEAGWVAPLNPLIDDPLVTDYKILDLDDFKTAPLDALKGKDGLNYGLPMFDDTTLLCFRKSIFESLGLTPPDTFYELMETCQDIKANTDIASIILRGRRGQGLNIFIWPMVLRGFGGKFFEDFSNDDFTPVLNSSEAKYAAEFYANLIQKYAPEGCVNFNWEDTKTAFMRGTGAMIIDAYMFAGDFEDPSLSEVAGDVGYTLVPRGPYGRFPAIAMHGMMIPKTAQKKKAAWQFMQWALSRDVQLKSALEGPRAAVTKVSVMEDEDYLAKYNFGYGEYKWAPVAVKSLNMALSYYRPLFFRKWFEVGDTVGMALQEVIAGDKSADVAMEELNQEVLKIIKKAKLPMGK